MHMHMGAYTYICHADSRDVLQLLIAMLSNLDWEQHRQDYLSALNRDPDYAAALVKHTILHWQSLFAATSTPFKIDNLFEESFEALINN